MNGIPVGQGPCGAVSPQDEEAQHAGRGTAQKSTEGLVASLVLGGMRREKMKTSRRTSTRTESRGELLHHVNGLLVSGERQAGPCRPKCKCRGGRVRDRRCGGSCSTT